MNVHEAAILEFPFVEAPPTKKAQSRLSKAWDLLNRMREATAKEGALVPVILVAKCFDLSRTRIDEICRDGRLRRVEVDGHVFITEDSIVSFAKVERKNGRPLKLMDECDRVGTNRACWNAAVEAGREMMQSRRQVKANKT